MNDSSDDGRFIAEVGYDLREKIGKQLVVEQTSSNLYLDSGGYGCVYKAKKKDGDFRAVKVIKLKYVLKNRLMSSLITSKQTTYILIEMGEWMRTCNERLV